MYTLGKLCLWTCVLSLISAATCVDGGSTTVSVSSVGVEGEEGRWGRTGRVEERTQLGKKNSKSTATSTAGASHKIPTDTTSGASPSQ